MVEESNAFEVVEQAVVEQPFQQLGLEVEVEVALVVPVVLLENPVVLEGLEVLEISGEGLEEMVDNSAFLDNPAVLLAVLLKVQNADFLEVQKVDFRGLHNAVDAVG